MVKPKTLAEFCEKVVGKTEIEELRQAHRVDKLDNNKDSSKLFNKKTMIKLDRQGLLDKHVDVLIQKDTSNQETEDATNMKRSNTDPPIQPTVVINCISGGFAGVDNPSMRRNAHIDP
ncbi:hypothetical protein PIB30_021563 [Stylosanthes scabra]|uniref:Uncharacterized protein n=1 Tax=Stylosanthes scabra TaxID=79078 RepID=A0ABU6S9H0_9FABA|nr:hypothetical protein [Stylosanthes scabra]